MSDRRVLRPSLTSAQRYIGPGVKYPPMENPLAGFVTRVTATTIRGIGPWTDPVLPSH